MGQNSTKSGPHRGPQLTESEHELVREALNAKNEKPNRILVKKSDLQPGWERALGADLSESFLSCLFRRGGGGGAVAAGGGVVSYDQFVSFYLRLVRDSNQARAGVLADALGEATSRGTAEIDSQTLGRFVCDLLSSYFRLLESAENRAVRSWTEGARVGFDSRGLDGFTSHLLAGSPSKLDASGLESVLYRSPLVGQILEAVFSFIYNLKRAKKLEGLLPEAVPGSGGWPPSSCLLGASEVLFLGSLLRPASPASGPSKWRLLFSSKRDGASWSTLVKHVSSQGPTLVLVEDSRGARFGAFASHSWSPSPTFYGSEDCFLFTVRPRLESFHPTGYTQNFQYLNQGQHTLPNGLGMGGQFGYWGLYLDSEFGSGQSSETCTTFREFKRLSSESPFRVSHLEVWAVGEPDPTPEQLGERVVARGGSALTADPTAEALLEAAGKQFHSKGFQELQPDDD